jgi:hypothetical protein
MRDAPMCRPAAAQRRRPAAAGLHRLWRQERALLAVRQEAQVASQRRGVPSARGAHPGLRPPRGLPPPQGVPRRAVHLRGGGARAPRARLRRRPALHEVRAPHGRRDRRLPDPLGRLLQGRLPVRRPLNRLPRQVRLLLQDARAQARPRPGLLPLHRGAPGGGLRARGVPPVPGRGPVHVAARHALAGHQRGGRVARARAAGLRRGGRRAGVLRPAGARLAGLAGRGGGGGRAGAGPDGAAV